MGSLVSARPLNLARDAADPAGLRWAFFGENWTPLVPTSQPGLFASLWEGQGLRLWTLVNRRNEPVSGRLFEMEARLRERVHDLIKGEELRTEAVAGRLPIDGTLPALSIGCILAGEPAQLGRDFNSFLRQQRQVNAHADFETATPQRETRLKAAASTVGAKQAPTGVVEIPPATLGLAIEMRSRECGYHESMPPRRHQLADFYRFSTATFRRCVEFKSFDIDLTC